MADLNPPTGGAKLAHGPGPAGRGRAAEGAAALRDGDIIFQTSRTSQSRAIQLATHSRYSHLGLVFHVGDRLMVIEAIGPVRWTPLSRFLARGEDGAAVVRRLRDADTRLTPAAVSRLRRAATHHLGKRYDRAFDWSDEQMYCSELVYKAYERGLGLELGPLQTLREMDLSNEVVKRKVAERYGRHIPLDSPVITPQAIFDSDLLDTVASFPE
jgi:hypothetical protein